MTTSFIFPTAEELRAVEQDLLPALVAQRPIFDIMPIRNADASVVAWEQMDNYRGLQQLRGIDGAPPKIARTGGKRYVMAPGVYGEFALIPEQELTERRKFGTFDQLVDVSDLVGIEQTHLMGRELDRVESIGWTLLTTGTFSVATLSGGVDHTDAYTLQTFSASVAWSTAATATPLADFRAVQLLGRGHSVNFGAQAKAYMNRITANRLFSNTNNADIYGRRTAGLGTFNSPSQINELLTGDDLPTIVIEDRGYLDDSGTFQPFIATAKVVVVGQRPGASPVAEYVMTRNANNDGMAPGSYTKVVDNGDDGVPRTIEVHRGHNGGPAIYQPSAVVVMSV